MAFASVGGKLLAWGLMPIALFTAGCVSSEDKGAPAAVLRVVVEAAAQRTPVETIVIDADVAPLLPHGVAGLPPMTRGATALDSDSRSLRPGQLAVTQFKLEGDQAFVETRTVTAHTHALDSGLDCGERQNIRLLRNSGEWIIDETNIVRC